MTGPWVYGVKAPDRNGGFAVNGIKVGVLIIGPNAGQGTVEDLLPEFRERPSGIPLR
jgi:hypothetical protein